MPEVEEIGTHSLFVCHDNRDIFVEIASIVGLEGRENLIEERHNVLSNHRRQVTLQSCAVQLNVVGAEIGILFFWIIHGCEAARIFTKCLGQALL